MVKNTKNLKSAITNFHLEAKKKTFQNNKCHQGLLENKQTKKSRENSKYSKSVIHTYLKQFISTLYLLLLQFNNC